MWKEFLKKTTWSDILIDIIFIVLGILLIKAPNAIMAIISTILGGIFILIGIFRLIDYFTTDKSDNYLLAIAILAIMVGVIIIFCYDIIISAFRILIAIWILYNGIMNLLTSIIWKDFKSIWWITSFIFSILIILGGIYVLISQGALIQTIGTIILIYAIIDICENTIFMKKINKIN